MKNKTLALVVALLAMAALAAVALAATTTVTVTPSNMGGWTVQTSGSGPSVTFEAGPATPPVGVGSAELAVGPEGNSAAQLRTANYAGVALSELTELAYSTYVDADASDGHAPYIILSVDYDGDGDTDDLLFFEPLYQEAAFFPSNPQPALLPDTWQTWDALNGGWWSTNGTAGAVPGTGVKPLADILAVEPTARIAVQAGLGGVRLVAGFAAILADNFIGNVDAFRIGVSGNTTIYNFEPAAPTAVSVRSFTADRTLRGVTLRWHTAHETTVVGFNVYRHQRSKLVKVNRTLIPSVSRGTASGHRYSWLDRRATRGDATYRLQAVSLSGKRSWIGTAVAAG